MLNSSHRNECFCSSICTVTGLTGVWLSVNVSGLNSSVVRALAWYARSLGFKSQLRLDFSPCTCYIWRPMYNTHCHSPGISFTAFPVLSEFGEEFQFKMTSNCYEYRYQNYFYYDVKKLFYFLYTCNSFKALKYGKRFNKSINMTS